MLKPPYQTKFFGWLLYQRVEGDKEVFVGEKNGEQLTHEAYLGLLIEIKRRENHYTNVYD